MSKFNVGDKVRVIKDSLDNPSVSALGCIGVVEKNGAVSGLPYGAHKYYLDDYLELVIATTQIIKPKPEQVPSQAHSEVTPLRDQFAMAALPALIARWHEGGHTHKEICAQQAYEYADAMLKAQQ